MRDGTAYLVEHRNEVVAVPLIDLLTLIARLEQVWQSPGFEADGITHQRIFTCDLPRLRAFLPVEALEILAAGGF